MRISLLRITCALIGLSWAGGTFAQELSDARFAGVLQSVDGRTESQRLAELLRIDWEVTLEESPELAVYYGIPGYEDRWWDLSPEARETQRKHFHARLAAIRSISREQLSPAEVINYDLFLAQAVTAVQGLQFPQHLLEFHQLAGVHQDAAEIMAMLPNRSLRQLDQQVARLRNLPALIDQTIALLEEGLARGITAPAITLRDVPEQVRNQIVETATESPLLEGMVNASRDLPAEEVALRLNEAEEIYSVEIRPRFEALERFLIEEYLPGARTEVAATSLPDGGAWYAHEVRRMTTTDYTPDEIHEIGLSEVARIRAEMVRIQQEVGFAGSLEEFFEFMRTNPDFFHTEPEALLAEYRDISKRIDAEMPKYFGLLPRLPYGVVPVPSYAEKSQTTAYYWNGSLKAGRPGLFFANTYALHTRPRWEMVALTLHEAVPGHHHQIALAQEIDDLPNFRRYSWAYTGFVEGWGLYAESLGEEMGLYEDPYAKFGQLTYEMWRAVRLVVDTGMHAKGWSRQKAIDYFKANASKTENDIIVEIDRYLVWPGQALAYKLGELKIKELRRRATDTLGERFDLRAFHDEVLRHGPVPLDVLEKNLNGWVSRHQ